MEVRSYSNQTERLYIHLLDGGLADNLGVRGFLEAVIKRDSVLQTMQDYHLHKLRKVILIVVNASVARDYQIGAREDAPGTVKTLRSAIRVPINRYSFETVEIFRDHMQKWHKEISQLRRASIRKKEGLESDGGLNSSVPEVDFHIIEINFNALQDATERQYFNSLPTNFKLPRGAANRLREVAGKLLRESPDWKAVLQEFHTLEAGRPSRRDPDVTSR
jgi:NTE family protein